MVTVSLMPVWLLAAAVKPVAPPAPTAVHDAGLIAAGKVSVTVAPITALGPAFDTTTVYVLPVPATAVVLPSVLVIDRSADGAVFVIVQVIVTPSPASTDVIVNWLPANEPWPGAALKPVQLNAPAAYPAAPAVSVSVYVPTDTGVAAKPPAPL